MTDDGHSLNCVRRNVGSSHVATGTIGLNLGPRSGRSVLARDGLLDAGSYSRFSHRHSSPDALWSEWTYSVRQGTCVHALATQRRDKCQDTGSRFVGAVPTYRPDWIVQGYAGIATGAFWDSCWWLRVGTVHPCPLVPHSLSYSASHRHFTTFKREHCFANAVLPFAFQSLEIVEWLTP